MHCNFLNVIVSGPHQIFAHGMDNNFPVAIVHFYHVRQQLCSHNESSVTQMRNKTFNAPNKTESITWLNKDFFFKFNGSPWNET